MARHSVHVYSAWSQIYAYCQEHPISRLSTPLLQAQADTENSLQVASHAQKYFIRLNSLNKKDKRRSSIHDITSPAGLRQNPDKYSSFREIISSCDLRVSCNVKLLCT